MKSKDNLNSVWDKYYKKSSRNTILKDDNFFRLEIQAILEQIKSYIQRKKTIKILELGSGSGYLASKICSNLLKNISYDYTAIDFSEEAVTKAKKRKIKNCTFIKNDFSDFLKNSDDVYDIIISQRSIMAIMNQNQQKKLLILIKKHMKQNSIGIFSEVTQQAFKKIQTLRRKIKLPPLEKVWHSRYLDETLLSRIFKHSKIIDFSSTYWLVTRVIYPFFEEPKHNSIIHKFAFNLSQEGDYGLVKLFIVKK